MFFTDINSGANVMVGQIKDLLKPELVIMDLKAGTKEEAIREMVGLLDRNGLLKNSEEALRVVLERESIMSTGMEKGIAIPHGKTDTVDSLITAVAIKRDGLDFESADGHPATILIITLSPASKTGPHIRFMAEISRILHNDEIRRKILETDSSQRIVELFTKGA